MTDPDLASARTDSPESEEQEEARRAGAVRALRRYVARHNWQALLLALFSLATALALWGLLYLMAYWFALVVATLSRSFSPATLLEINDPELVSANFPWWFLAGALCALGAACVVRKRMRLESLRDARLYLLWVVAELLMAVPNVTFSIWGNLSALVRLRVRDAERAWSLLERIHEHEGRLSVASLPLEIQDASMLDRVVFVLQIVGLVELREKREGWFLCLQNRDAFALLHRGDHAA
jgi:hypothetical protein